MFQKQRKSDKAVQKNEGKSTARYKKIGSSQNLMHIE
jgi:hypothetical protein